MASITHFLIFTVFIFAIIQIIASESSEEWNVERSSVNPLSYTDEERYPRSWTTENPLLALSGRRRNCSEKEHFSFCDANCQTTCDNYNKPNPCPKFCVWGCICDLGYIRGPDRKCIKPEECPNKQHSEMQPDDVWVSELTTERPQYEETENPEFEKTKFPPYTETENRESLSSKQWPFPPMPIPLICRANEALDPCPSSCQDDCNNFRKKNHNCWRVCIPSCVCKKGFVRSHDGKCIKPHECPQEKNFCPSGEEYSPCHSHCEGNCIPGAKNKSTCKKGRLCVPGCTCKEGLVRGPDGTCIYASECPTTPPKEPPTKVCPKNELYEVCKAACQRNCSNIDSALPCPRICQPGCVCKESMIRGKYGKCIDSDECPKETSLPESDVTLNPPPYTDDDYHIPESVTENPPVASERDNRLTLETEDMQFEQTEIPPISQSKPTHSCPPLETWAVCGSHCQRNCSNKDVKDLRCRPVCIPGCVCKQGLVRGPEGKCIEKDKCPTESDSEGNQFPIFCSRNEFIDPCPSSCPDDCNNYKDTNRNCYRVCIPKCSCKRGFVRGPDGKCIKPTECPEKKETCRRDEMFSSCHGNCEKNCSNWADDLVCPKKCVPGCVCRPGRIRAPDGKCIIFSQCPRSTSDSVRYPDVFPIESLPPVEPTDSPLFPVFVESSPVPEDDQCRITTPLCPDDKVCDCACKTLSPAKGGECTGPDHKACMCHRD